MLARFFRRRNDEEISDYYGCCVDGCAVIRAVGRVLKVR